MVTWRGLGGIGLQGNIHADSTDSSWGFLGGITQAALELDGGEASVERSTTSSVNRCYC